MKLFNGGVETALFGMSRGADTLDAVVSRTESAPVRRAGVYLLNGEGERVARVGEHLSKKQLASLAAKLAKNRELLKAARGMGSVLEKAPYIEALFSGAEAISEFQNGHTADGTISSIQTGAAICAVACPPPVDAIALGVGIGISVGKIATAED